jgi:hypothetical protein
VLLEQLGYPAASLEALEGRLERLHSDLYVADDGELLGPRPGSRPRARRRDRVRGTPREL